MASAKDVMSDGKHRLNMIINGVITVLIVIFTQYLTASDTDRREYDEKLESKASKEYVKEAITEHEKVDAARYQGISDMFEVIRQEQIEARHDIKELLRKTP